MWLRLRRIELHAVGFVAAVAFLVAGCTPGDDSLPGEDPPPRDPGTVVWGFEHEPGSLNPTLDDGTGPAAEQIVLATLLPLWRITPAFTYEPTALLASTDVAEGPPFVVTYNLNPAATWSDGTPITAGDVFFTIEANLQTEIDAVAAVTFDTIDIDATRARLTPESKTIDVVFTDAYGPWQTLFSTADSVILPRHVLSGRLGLGWEDVWRDAITNPDTGEAIASGPFMFSRWERDEHIELVRNDRYGGTAANLERLIVTFTGNHDVTVQRLGDGSVDVMSAEVVEPDLMERLREIGGVSFQTAAGSSWEHISIQHTRPGLDRQYVRRALAMAIDREAFVERVIRRVHPDATVLNSLVYVPNQQYYEDHFGDVAPYDPSGAIALLEQNGCSRGDDGVFVCAGERLAWEWTTTTDNERRRLFFSYVQEALAAVGMEITPTFGEASTLFTADVFAAGNFDLFNLAFASQPDPARNVEIFGCFNAERTAGGDRLGRQNYHGYCPDPQVSDWLLETNRVTDPAQRASLMNAAGRALAQEVPIIPLYQPPTMLVWRDHLTGPRANPTPWGPAWNIADWLVSP